MSEHRQLSVKQPLIELARDTIDKEIESLVAARDRIGLEFDDAVSMLAELSGKVITTGVGKSGLVSRKIAATLCSIGIPAMFVHPVDALHGDLGILQSGDVLVLLSKSGETEELKELCSVIGSTDCQTLGIIGGSNSTLAKRCDVVIDASVDREACPLNLAPTSSTMVAMALGDALAACLVQRVNLSSEGFSRLHPSGSLGKRLLLRVRDVMHKSEDIPLVRPGTVMRTALVTLSTKSMGAILIVSESGELRGILTDGDLRRCLQQREDILNLPIDELMSPDPIVTEPDAMAVEAMRVMEDRLSQISVLPVVANGRQVVGIIRLHDLVKAGL